MEGFMFKTELWSLLMNGNNNTNAMNFVGLPKFIELELITTD